MKLRMVGAALLTLGVLSCLPCYAFDPGDAGAVERGRQRFQEYCATCHGSFAAGDGPQAADLDTPPPDLTLLTRRHGGIFPIESVYNSIDGRNPPPGHGSREMPVWGMYLKPNLPAYGEVIVQGRIMELILFLESIQKP